MPSKKWHKGTRANLIKTEVAERSIECKMCIKKDLFYCLKNVINADMLIGGYMLKMLKITIKI